MLTSPEGVYRPRREALAGLEHRLALSAEHRLSGGRQALSRLSAHLGALNPLGVLGRGYALVQGEDGHVIPAAAALAVGDRVTLRFADGTAHARVASVPHTNESEEPAHDGYD